MGRSKTSPDSQPNEAPDRMPDAEIQAFAAGRFCKPCRKEFRTPFHRAQHDRSKHVGTAVRREAPPERPVPPPLKPGEMVFISVKSPSMRLVLPGHQARWVQVQTPGGISVDPLEGIEIQFDHGTFTTSDPAIIAYLTKDEEACKRLGVVDRRGRPMVYNDPRWPVFAQSQLREMAVTY